MKYSNSTLTGDLLCAVGLHKKQIDIINKDTLSSHEEWRYICARECGWHTKYVYRHPGHSSPEHDK